MERTYIFPIIKQFDEEEKRIFQTFEEARLFELKRFDDEQQTLAKERKDIQHGRQNGYQNFDSLRSKTESLQYRFNQWEKDHQNRLHNKISTFTSKRQSVLSDHRVPHFFVSYDPDVIRHQNLLLQKLISTMEHGNNSDLSFPPPHINGGSSFSLPPPLPPPPPHTSQIINQTNQNRVINPSLYPFPNHPQPPSYSNNINTPSNGQFQLPLTKSSHEVQSYQSQQQTSSIGSGGGGSYLNSLFPSNNFSLSNPNSNNELIYHPSQNNVIPTNFSLLSSTKFFEPPGGSVGGNYLSDYTQLQSGRQNPPQ